MSILVGVDWSITLRFLGVSLWNMMKQRKSVPGSRPASHGLPPSSTTPSCFTHRFISHSPSCFTPFLIPHWEDLHVDRHPSYVQDPTIPSHLQLRDVQSSVHVAVVPSHPQETWLREESHTIFRCRFITIFLNREFESWVLSICSRSGGRETTCSRLHTLHIMVRNMAAVSPEQGSLETWDWGQGLCNRLYIYILRSYNNISHPHIFIMWLTILPSFTGVYIPFPWNWEGPLTALINKVQWKKLCNLQG